MQGISGSSHQPLFVTRPSMPPLAELLPLLEEIWDNRIVSNGGPLLRRFEATLSQYLGVDNLPVVTNASLGLVLAMRALGVDGGEVLTTPFSFVASTHAIHWAGATPVFADIEPATLGLDPESVAAAITPRTRAILAVHSYGHACLVDELEALARRHGLPVIYDAAHCFGVELDGQSILSRGDASVVSFHGTKVFHTCEGGAVRFSDRHVRQTFDVLVNHGIADEATIPAIGLNAKASELQAALGLALLPHAAECIARRAALDTRYREMLADVQSVHCLAAGPRQKHNYYNFPIRIAAEGMRDAAFHRLRAAGVMVRRYFHPLISQLDSYRNLPSADPERLPVASAAARQMLVLPLYPDLAPADQSRIVEELRIALASPPGAV